jgi:hypothetical protein
MKFKNDISFVLLVIWIGLFILSLIVFIFLFGKHIGIIQTIIISGVILIFSWLAHYAIRQQILLVWLYVGVFVGGLICYFWIIGSLLILSRLIYNVILEDQYGIFFIPIIIVILNSSMLAKKYIENNNPEEVKEKQRYMKGLKNNNKIIT